MTDLCCGVGCTFCERLSVEAHRLRKRAGRRWRRKSGRTRTPCYCMFCKRNGPPERRWRLEHLTLAEQLREVA